MTQDEVLKELRDVIAGNQQFTTWTVSTPHLVELVNRAIKAEREACAKMCEIEGVQWLPDFKAAHQACISNAEAIRARGEQA